MKKRILCLTLALIISGAQVVSVSATREDEAALQQEMDATNEQLNATYSRLASRVEISPSICDFCAERSSNLE